MECQRYVDFGSLCLYSSKEKSSDSKPNVRYEWATGLLFVLLQ